MTETQPFIDQQIDQYQVEKFIAQGGMADVYLAKDVNLERKVALKVLLPVLAADSQFVARFRREAQTAARLEHPNIVQVYGISSTLSGQPYIAMQFIEGGDLGQLIKAAREKRQHISAVQALQYLRPIASALNVAHAAGIVHRDLKPSNILLREDGTPILVDLGIAAVPTGTKLTNTGTFIGTPAYMSPEQARGKQLDGRSDIYSFGVVLYEILAGRPPFEASDPFAILHKHVYEEPPPLSQYRPELSPTTSQLVHQCLQKEPELRPGSANELLMQIDYAIQAESTSDTQPYSAAWTDISIPPYGEQKKSFFTRGRLLAIGGAALLFLLIGCLIAFSVFNALAGEDDTTPDSLTNITQTIEIVSQTITIPDETTAAGPTSTFASLPTFTSTPKPTNTSQPTATDTPDLPTFVDGGIVTEVIGRSVNNVNIEAVRFGTGSNVVLFIGGLHAGAAPSTVLLANQAIDYFTANQTIIPAGLTVYVIPNANPDSPLSPGNLAGRLNANRVDINRNWDCRWTEDALWRNEVVPGSGGPEPFSEPETQTLVNFITEKEPVAVVFWEARATGGLASPGWCGGPPSVSQTLANVYGSAAGYNVGDFEEVANQTLNGDGTNWLDQQGIPAIAVLLPAYESVDWGNNLDGILAVLSFAN